MPWITVHTPTASHESRKVKRAHQHHRNIQRLLGVLVKVGGASILNMWW